MSLALALDPLSRARTAATRRRALQALMQAELRVADATAARWPALADSWRKDVTQIRALIEQRFGPLDPQPDERRNA